MKILKTLWDKILINSNAVCTGLIILSLSFLFHASEEINHASELVKIHKENMILTMELDNATGIIDSQVNMIIRYEEKLNEATFIIEMQNQAIERFMQRLKSLEQLLKPNKSFDSGSWASNGP